MCPDGENVSNMLRNILLTCGQQSKSTGEAQAHDSDSALHSRTEDYGKDPDFMNGAGAYAIVGQVLQRRCHHQYAGPGQSAGKILQPWILDAKMMNARYKHDTAGVADISWNIQAIAQRTVCRACRTIFKRDGMSREPGSQTMRIVVCE